MEALKLFMLILTFNIYFNDVHSRSLVSRSELQDVVSILTNQFPESAPYINSEMISSKIRELSPSAKIVMKYIFDELRGVPSQLDEESIKQAKAHILSEVSGLPEVLKKAYLNRLSSKAPPAYDEQRTDEQVWAVPAAGRTQVATFKQLLGNLIDAVQNKPSSQLSSRSLFGNSKIEIQIPEFIEILFKKLNIDKFVKKILSIFKGSENSDSVAARSLPMPIMGMDMDAFIKAITPASEIIAKIMDKQIDAIAAIPSFFRMYFG